MQRPKKASEPTKVGDKPWADHHWPPLTEASAGERRARARPFALLTIGRAVARLRAAAAARLGSSGTDEDGRVRARAESHFAGIVRGFLTFRVDNENEPPPGPEQFGYESGDHIVHDGAEVGTITRRLGQGNFGTVYELRRVDGTLCAAKAIREDIKENRIKTEKELAVEVSINFALGKSALIAPALGMVIPLPGVNSTAKGLLLLSDLVDGGDLEEAMHKQPAREDYDGFLYTDKGMVRWALGSLTLQTFTAFVHIHSRGVIHQASLDNPEECDFFVPAF